MSAKPNRGNAFAYSFLDAFVPIHLNECASCRIAAFAPVGSRELRRFSGQIVAATHRSSDALRESGALRDDFYYRWCSNVRARAHSLEHALSAVEVSAETLVEQYCYALYRRTGSYVEVARVTGLDSFRARAPVEAFETGVRSSSVMI